MEFSAYFGELWHDDFNENHSLIFTISVPKINIEQAKKSLERSKITQTNDVITSIDKFNFALKQLDLVKDFIEENKNDSSKMSYDDPINNSLVDVIEKYDYYCGSFFINRIWLRKECFYDEKIEYVRFSFEFDNDDFTDSNGKIAIHYRGSFYILHQTIQNINTNFLIIERTRNSNGDVNKIEISTPPKSIYLQTFTYYHL
jgi:hypothetical protein